MMEIKNKIKELKYKLYGNYALKYYDGFELKIVLDDNLSEIKDYAVDYEFYGPLSNDGKKQLEKAYNIIESDIELINEELQKNFDDIERKLISLGYKKHGFEYYIKKKDFLELSINYDKEDEGLLEEFCGVNIPDDAGYAFYDDAGVDTFSVKVKAALKELKEDINVIKNIKEKGDNNDE